MLENWVESVRAMLFALIVIIGTFCIVHLTWYWGIKLRYEDAIWDLFVDAAIEREQIKVNGTYEVVEDGYRYRVYGTKYLESSGFACISAETGWNDEAEELDHMLVEDGSKVILNIGFKVFCHYSFQIDIKSVNGRYQIEVDQYGNLITDEYTDPGYKKKLNKILEQNRAEIDHLFCSANEKWNIQ